MADGESGGSAPSADDVTRDAWIRARAMDFL